MQNLLEDLKKLLAKDERFTAEGELLKNKIVESALKLDEDLVKLLLSHKKLREHFFTKVDKALIFDKDKFVKFVSNKQFLPDSYTAFKNKIGLTEGDEYISEKKDVVLSWPYKDCVLEGGQTKEDAKRDEIFWNQTLAPDEIDRLLDPKVFTGAKRIDKKGEHAFDKFNRREDPEGKLSASDGAGGTISDNLIVKGNNLLALHSLKKEFAGKVKLIYIDPPYNTGNDSFGYNDKFNHSTWLTFMKNRLEVAKELLSKQGSIWVQIDHHELSYLNMLLDEIFGTENKIQIISIKTSSPAGFKTINPGPVEVTEYLLWYAKDKSNFKFKDGYTPVSYDSNYNLYIENINSTPEDWEVKSIIDKFYEVKGIKNNREAKDRWGEQWKTIRDLMIGKFALNNADRVVSKRDPHKPTEKLKRQLKKSRNEGVLVVEREDYDPLYLYDGGSLAFYSNKIKKIDGEYTPTELLTDFWGDISWAGIANEGKVKLKAGKKPEKLLQRIINLSTDDSEDIVLDFFSGVGTTSAVAHKLGRQWITTEQLSSQIEKQSRRMKNVLDGDKTGISNSVNWQGGGDYVYLELAEWNQEFVEKVKESKSKKELEKIWGEMQKRAFLSWRLDFDKLEKNAKDFDGLSLENQKKFLLEILDQNQLYINYSEIEDEMYGVSEEDRKLNKEFYGK